MRHNSVKLVLAAVLAVKPNDKRILVSFFVMLGREESMRKIER
jgi:hypothetical protein